MIIYNAVFLFDMLATIIESFACSLFIIYSLELNNKKLLLITTMIFFIEIYVFNNVLYNNVILFIIFIVTGMTICSLYTKQIKIKYIYMSFLGLCIMLLSDITAIFMTTMFFSLMNLSLSSTEFYIVSVVLSKVFVVLLSLFLIKVMRKDNLQLEFSKWWSLALFYVIIAIMAIVLGESITGNFYSIRILQSILLLIIILFIISIFIYHRIKKETQLQIELSNKIIRNEYINANYEKMNYMFNKTVEDRHRMMYILMKIKYLIDKNNIDELKDVLNQEIFYTNKSQFVIFTSNPYFDYRLQEKINILKEKDFDVKTIFQIKRLDVLTDKKLIEDIIYCIDFLIDYANENKQMFISLKQKDLYLIIKISVLTDLTDKKNNLELTSDLIKKSNLKINQDECTITLLITL